MSPVSLVLPRPSAVLVDIEGTISSLPHVVETHYPFTRRHIAAYLEAHGDEPEIVKALADTRALAKPGESELHALYRWIDEDTKAPPLKRLQGLVWITGYASGELQGHIYPDAFLALTDWRRQGLAVHIFSSGSAQSQVQFFQHCPDGDHRQLFVRHFDIGIGAKVDPLSYAKIATALNVRPESIVFFSDNPRELDAASSQGVVGIQVLREGAAADGRFPSLDDLRAVSWGDRTATQGMA